MDMYSSMNIQHGHAAQTRSMDKQHGQAAWTCSMDMRHGHAASTCSMDMQKGHAAWKRKSSYKKVNLPPHEKGGGGE
jgi:hypothetical protein